MPGPYDDFQRRSSEIGKAFANYWEITLRSIGFILKGKTVIKDAGVEIDQLAINRKGEPLYFEFKGSSKPPRPGMQRTDTVKKALCNAFLLNKIGMGPFIVITSHKPKQGSSGAKMIELAKDVLFDVICMGVDEDMDRLQSYVQFLPWRNRTVATQRANFGFGPTAEAKTQLELFNIESLRRFPKSKVEKEQRPQEQKKVV
jgi:hypothetical protein